MHLQGLRGGWHGHAPLRGHEHSADGEHGHATARDHATRRIEGAQEMGKPAVARAIVVGFTLALTALALAGCGPAENPVAAQDELVIYSPHADEIREEFGWAFQAWYEAQVGRTVEVKWPDAGGTSQIVKRLQDKFKAGRHDIDIVFGGGPIYQEMKQQGMLEPCRLPEAVLRAIPREVAGEPLYDADFYYYGAALSTFGLIYNKDLIRARGLPEVKDWATMADPAYFGLVGVGDATKSGSVRKVYEIILEAYGYERGLALLIRTGANAREWYASASEVPRNCAAGFLAVGPCIDFYADRQMHSEGGASLGFVAPKGLTVLNADPIGLLKKAPHRWVAEKFLEFVLSEPGQALWMLPAGAPGGPRKFALERMAILPSVYELPAVKALGERTDPFTLPPATFYSAAKENARITILPDYLRVAAVENYDPLRRAWKAIIDAGLPEPLVAEFVKPLLSEDEMIRLGKEVWKPVVVPKDATPEKAAELKVKEEMRLREKSELERKWRKALRERYVVLAQRAMR
jgi:ABC-type Fe3+ transport system substrate-binding protein